MLLFTTADDWVIKTFLNNSEHWQTISEMENTGRHSNDNVLTSDSEIKLKEN